METGNKSKTIYCTYIYKRIIVVCALVSLVLGIITPFSMRASTQKKEKLQSSGVRTTAEIIGFNVETTADTERIVISFADESGAVHTMPLGFFAADMYIGQQVPIIYDPKNINTIMYAGDNSALINFGGGVTLLISSLILAVLAIITYIQLRRIRRRMDLLNDGRLVVAELESVEPKIDFGARKIFILKCSYTHANGEKQLMSSQYLRYNPESFLENGKVKVYFESNNPLEYHVDVENSLVREL